MNRTKWIVVALAGLGSLCCLAAAALVGVGYLASNVATPDPAPAVEHPLSAQQVTVHADRVITETAISAISLARIDAKPEEIARVILFLCSEEARLIHGASIPVYGND